MFPVEILVEILEYVNEYQDIANMMTTCKSLYLFPRVYRIGNERVNVCSFLVDDREKHEKKYSIVRKEYKSKVFLGRTAGTNIYRLYYRANTKHITYKTFYPLKKAPDKSFIRLGDNKHLVSSFIIDKGFVSRYSKPKFYWYSSGLDFQYGFMAHRPACPGCSLGPFKECMRLKHRLCSVCLGKLKPLCPSCSNDTFSNALDKRENFCHKCRTKYLS